MNIQIVDRRVRRTRKLLKQGLCELMGEKDFKDISVKDITDRMDLNRGTFYLHYTDIYDLLEKIETDVLNDFQEMLDKYRPKTNTKTLIAILEPLADYIDDNSQICKILFENKASSDFSYKFINLIVKNGASLVQERFGIQDPGLLDYFFYFVTYGIIGMIKKWLEGGKKKEKKELITLCDDIISAAAAKVLVKS